MVLSISPLLNPEFSFPKLTWTFVIILFSLFYLFTQPLLVVVTVFVVLFYSWNPDPPFNALTNVFFPLPVTSIFPLFSKSKTFGLTNYGFFYYGLWFHPPETMPLGLKLSKAGTWAFGKKFYLPKLGWLKVG